MQTNRRLAVAAGVAFLIATVAQLIGVALASPILGAPDYLTQIPANEGRVILGAFFQFMGALACPAIAIALYPVLRKHDEGLALGSVGFRTIEGGLHVLITVCMLMLVTVSQEWLSAGAAAAPAYEVSGSVLLTARESLAPVSVIVFGLGAMMYYWVFYRSRLVPRWLSVWGLVAVPLVALSAVLVMFRVIDNLSTPQVILALPIAVQEMVIAVWLIAKGFDSSAIAMEPADEASMPRAAASTEPAATRSAA